VLTSAAFCWRLERRDGAGVALTSHDRSLLREGVRYLPSPGMVPAAIVRRNGLEPHSGEIDGAISNDALTDEDLELGRWDGARIALVAIDWTGDEPGELLLMGGEIDSVATSDAGFTAELRGAAGGLDAPACPDTSPECRARLGDRQCRVDLSDRRSLATSLIHDGNRITVNPAPGAEFGAGEVQVLSGPMTGFRSTILGVDDEAIVLRDAPRGAIEPGTRLWLTEGCDKRFETCVDRFANAINFRGEPHLPGNDLLTRYPGA
jgi:uncharacterized phage protein (TIGR02218 family)